MADVRPFKALHYDLGKVGALDAVAAPPYDGIDAAGRAALLERSPYNAVAIDLPKAFDPADPASKPEGDPYEGAAQTIETWRSRTTKIRCSIAGAATTCSLVFSTAESAMPT